MKKVNGQFRSTHRFKREDLIKSLLKYHIKPNLRGKNNPSYKHGKHKEEYVRIRVNGIKVRRSHIVWMLMNNKDHIPLGYDIHHRDENKKNDNPENLELIVHVWHSEMNLINGRNKSKCRRN